MASYGYTFQSGDGVTPTRLNDARTVSDIVNADISATAGIVGTKIANDTIVNANIKSDAAIAGTKIAPAFGAQDITVSTANRSITNTGNFALSFGTNNTERVRITNDGNVGIGTSSPGTPLHVSGTSNFGIVSIASTSANAEASLSFFDSSDTNEDRWVVGKNINLTSDALCFYRDGNRMVITSGGNVGIGTTTPASKLDVDGNISISGAQAVTSRRTGWAAPTGTATRTTFATSTVTTAQLAERVKALIDDLTAHGLIGT